MADPDMLFDINFKDTCLEDALSDFFRQAGRAYTIDDSLNTGIISVRAADLGFQDTLKLLLPTGYTVSEIEGVYHIRRLDEAA